MPKDKSEVVINGKAVFYAVLYNDFKKAALDLGYTLALHGSMARDMDLLAVAWTEDAKSVEELAAAISDCIGETVWKEHHLMRWEKKPHGRISYTLSIMGDWSIDLSIIPPLLNQGESDERNATQQTVNQGTEPLSHNVADLLKDFKEELEKECKSYINRVTFSSGSVDPKRNINLRRGIEQGANWTYTHLLPIIEKLQKDYNMLSSDAFYYKSRMLELSEQKLQLQQENDKQAMDFAIWISGYENLTQAKRFWHCETTVELYNIFRNNTLKQKA